MPASSVLPAPSIVPLMRYRDVAAAVDWLCSALGFEKQVAVSDPDGTVYYAQLTFGTSMVMLGSVRDTDLDKLMRQPDEVGGVETQSCYLVVDDADAHYAKATAAGAEIVLDIKSDSFGRRGYSCKDPEGHIWNFGTYNPWKGAALPATVPVPEKRALRPAAVAAMAAVLLAAVAVGGWWLSPVLLETAGLAPPAPDATASPPAEAGHSAATRPATPEGEATPETLADMRAAKEAAEFAADAAKKDLEEAVTAKKAAEGIAEAARAELDRERTARMEALRTVQELEAKLAAERIAKEAATRAAAEAKLELEKARGSSGRAARDSKQRSSEAGGAAAPREGAPIETAATPAPSERTPGSSDAVWTVASEGKVVEQPARLGAIKARRTRKRFVQMPFVRRYKPTYVTDLTDVPWPYNIWYPRR